MNTKTSQHDTTRRDDRPSSKKHANKRRRSDDKPQFRTFFPSGKKLD